MSAVLTKKQGSAEAQPKVYTLTAAHRCDRCGAQAYVHVILESGNDLMYCNHHWTKNKVAMVEQGIIDTVIDESDRLDTGNRLMGSANS